MASLPLNEGMAANAVRPGPRGVAWRADAPATLSWVRDLGRGAKLADGSTTARDAWFTLAAPFSAPPVEQQRFEYRVTGVQWGADDLALVTESWSTTRRLRTWRVAPGQPGGERTLLFDRTSEDRYRDPGRGATVRNAFGRLVLARRPGDGRIFLTGAGASPEGDRPFLDEYDPATRASRRLWRSAPPHYEEFVAFLDADFTRALVMREAAGRPADFLVRDYARGELRPLTAFAHPHPQLTGLAPEVIRYKRPDGLELSGTLYLPPGYRAGDPPRPALLWAYPREFLDPENAGQMKATPERFTRISVSGPLPFLLAGYVVLNDPAMPIVAEKGKKPNDTYLPQLVANARAAIDELVRRGGGGPEARRDRRPQLRGLHDREPAGALGPVPRRHRPQRRLQPHPHALRLPERAAHVLAGAGGLQRDVALPPRGQDQGPAPADPRRRRQQLRHLPDPDRTVLRRPQGPRRDRALRRPAAREPRLPRPREPAARAVGDGDLAGRAPQGAGARGRRPRAMKSRLLWLAVLAAALAGFYEGTLGTARRTAPPVVDRQRINREFADFKLPPLPVPDLPRAEINVPLPEPGTVVRPAPPGR